MVARDMPPGGLSDELLAAVRSVVNGLMVAWQRGLTTLVVATRRLGVGLTGWYRRWRAQWPRVVAYLRDPASSWSAVDRAEVGTAAAFGARAFVFGLAAASVAEVAFGGTARQALSSTLVEVLWALGRFAVIAALVPADILPRTRTTLAYLAGLAPFGFAVWAPLRLVALGVSALVTVRGLEAAGLSSRHARQAIAWAFGGQVAVIAFGVLARGVLALVIAA